MVKSVYPLSNSFGLSNLRREIKIKRDEFRVTGYVWASIQMLVIKTRRRETVYVLVEIFDGFSIVTVILLVNRFTNLFDIHPKGNGLFNQQSKSIN